MKRKLLFGAVVAGAVMVVPAARAGHKGADCAPPCILPPPPHLQLTVIPEKYTDCVEGKKETVMKAVARPAEREVVRCRTVPVCVTDPHTGRTATEYRQETYVERVKVTVIDLVPEEVVIPPKKVEKVRNCFIISVCGDALPAACPAPAPAPRP